MSVFVLRLIIFLYFFTTITVQNVNYRIVGGEEVQNIEEYPYMAAVNKASDIHDNYCGGTIITKDWILTAAHCVCDESTTVAYGPEEFVVLVGFLSLRQLTDIHINYVKSLHVHDNYSSPKLSCDIALVQITKPLKLNSRINLATLPSETNSEPADLYKICETLGWGAVNLSDGNLQGNLKRVFLPLIHNHDCIRYYTSEDITDNNICTLNTSGGYDACVGDSGGPLMCNKIQFGITSWGESCADPKYPGVYTRVDQFLNWINSKVKNNILNISENYYLIIISLFLIIILY